MSDFEVYLSFDEMPVDDHDPVADGKDSLLADAPWANPDAAPLTTKAERSLMKRLDSHAEARAKAAKPKPPKLVVPHPRDLHDGAKPSIGWDVYALQRALSKAKLRKWGVFTRVYGHGTYRQVRRFQQTHGLHVDGVYGVQTHKKLAPFYDAHGIWLINRVHIQTPAELRRARLLTAAQVMYNRGSIVHYTQGPNRMWIVRHHYTLAQLSTMPVDYEDCSSGVTALYYVSGLEDPNRLNYNGQGFCHEPGARLLTSDLRWVAAGDIKIGDELWALDETGTGQGRRSRRCHRRALVTASFGSSKESVRVCVDTGETLVCSLDHPWLTQSKRGSNTHKWTRAADLTTDHMLVRPFIPWKTDTSYEAGWLAGMFDGEGWVVNRGIRGGRTNGVGITQVLGPTADRLIERCHRAGSFTVRLIERPGIQPRVDVTSNGDGVAGAAAFIGSIRAERLIENFNIEGGEIRARYPARVVAVESVGQRDVQSIQTTHGTYIAEGFAVHNTGTLGAHGTPIGPGQAKVGALYFYGQSPYDHVTINVGVDRCWSQGNEYAPDILNPWYRTITATHEYGGLP